jgi:hypothetical protein
MSAEDAWWLRGAGEILDAFLLTLLLLSATGEAL